MDEPPLAYRMWELHFEEGATGNRVGRILLPIRYPKPVTGVADLVEIPSAGLMDGASMQRSGANFLLLCLPPGSQTPYEMQRTSETWVTGCGNEAEGDAVIEVPISGGRLRFRPGRGVMIGREEFLADTLAGIAHFIWLSHQVTALEAEIEDEWQVFQNDAEIVELANIGSLTRQRLVMQSAVATRRRQWFLRATIGLERSGASLSPRARRTFVELAVQSDLATRLKLLDDCIEAAEDLYERHSDRITELRMFAKGLIVEIAILGAILAEFAVVLCDLLRE